MPGDSLLINNKAVAGNTYDAIVIGSGISGGWAAKELTEKGLRVLMLERGPRLDHISGYKTASYNPWDFPHRGAATCKTKNRQSGNIQGLGDVRNCSPGSNNGILGE